MENENNCNLPLSLPLTKELAEEAVVQAKDYALTHGVTMRSKESPSSSEAVNFAPFTLLPTPIPRKQFEHVCGVQKHMNQLVHSVANDPDFLTQTLKQTINVDGFTAKLFQIFEKVNMEGLAQRHHLGLLRADYMIGRGSGLSSSSTDGISIKQIEINTIASSFSGLGAQVASLHGYIMRLLGCSDDVIEKHLPASTACLSLSKALYEAYKLYGNQSSVIVFLVEDVTRNIFDQRWLEYGLRSLSPHDVRVLRRTLTDFVSRAKLNPDKTLEIDGYEVAVVYYRDGYVPAAYTSDKSWHWRLEIERSKAIKCPSIHYHLAGTKKVQQQLSVEGVVERYVSDAEVARMIRETFAAQFSLDLTSEGDLAAASGVKDPQRYVLKPQLEGGGNNLFGEQISKELKRLAGSEERSKYILMEKIEPLKSPNYLIRPHGDAILQDTVTELGIFGATLGTSDHLIMNEHSGHLLRSKSADTEEGGVAAGFAFLDSPYLV